MNKTEVLAKMREIASSDEVTVNKHFEADDHIRWYWAWQSAEQASEWTTKDLAEIYFEDGIKPYSTVDQVIDEIVDFDGENIEATFDQFKKFLKGELD